MTMHNRQYMSALLVLVVLTLPVVLSSMPEAHAIRVTDYFTCKFVDSTGRWEKKTSQFETNDVAAYVWFELTELVIGTIYNLLVYWRNPNQEVYTTSSGSFRASGNSMPLWASMAILGRAPEKQPGQWSAETYYSWAGGPATFGFKVEFTIGKLAPTVTTYSITVSVNQQVPITIDGATYSDLPKTFTWEKDSPHTLTAKKEVPGEAGVRYVFESWSDGNTALSRTITVTGPMTYSANYKTQYYLTVRSDQGDPSGEGWYDAGANAYATLEMSKVSADFLNDYVFKGWKGDARGSQPKSSAIKMDGPKTAEAIWEKQFSITFYVVIVSVVVLVILILVFFIFKRGIIAPGRFARVSPPLPPPPPPPIRTKAPASVSPSSIICAACETPNTPDNSFCVSCGKPLRQPGK